MPIFQNGSTFNAYFLKRLCFNAYFSFPKLFKTFLKGYSSSSSSPSPSFSFFSPSFFLISLSSNKQTSFFSETILTKLIFSLSQRLRRLPKTIGKNSFFFANYEKKKEKESKKEIKREERGEAKEKKGMR